MSTIPFTSGTCCCSIASIPWRSVTSAIPHPWQPPAMRTMTTASCTSISSTRPPCRATMGFTWLSNRSATRSYSASSAVALPALAGATGLDATAGWPPPSAARIAWPTAVPTPRQAVAERLLHALERLHDLGGTRHPGRVNVVDARPDLVGIAVLFEALQQLRPGARVLDRDHVRVHLLDHADDVVEFAVTHVGMDLGR